MHEIIQNASCVGFSGSRSGVPTAPVLQAVFAVSPGVPIAVGCQRGVDEVVRATARAIVFHARNYGTGPSAYARRSIACVEFVKSLNGLWIAFPSSPCPEGLRPSSKSSRCFCGTGSGTWASAAYAAGLSIPVLIYSPFPIPEWGFTCVADHWYILTPTVTQLSLF